MNGMQRIAERGGQKIPTSFSMKQRKRKMIDKIKKILTWIYNKVKAVVVWVYKKIKSLFTPKAQ